MLFVFSFLLYPSYCPNTDTYIDLAELPLKEWFCFDVTSIGCIVYVHGGVSRGDASKKFYSYDIRIDKWIEMPDMLYPRRRCAAAIMTVTGGGIGVEVEVENRVKGRRSSIVVVEDI